MTNRGTEADRLVSATAQDARTVEIHMMEMKNDVMVMRPVDGGLEIGPGETVELKPGGLHLMFMGVEKPFAEGQSVTRRSCSRRPAASRRPACPQARGWPRPPSLKGT